MHKLKSLIPQSIKNLYHLVQAVLANVVYGFPSRNIKIIGVTGTNGKTTTVQMIGKILEEAGYKTAIASTINFKINGEEEINRTKFTTLSSFQVQKFIRKAVESGCEYLVLETSSHALHQYRIWGIEYQIAVITNVTREHLDYHETMESYRKAKLKLFEKAKIAVVNLDMIEPEEFLNLNIENRYGFTICHSERSVAKSKNLGSDLSATLEMTNIVKAENIELGIRDTRYKIGDTNFVIHLPGMFNVENALAATCVGLAENIDLETINKALEKIKLVPGRMESVANDRDINIIIDYAVTPDSLEKIYDLIKSIRDNSMCHPELVSGSLNGEMQMLKQVQHDIQNIPKIISVFGSCGERDRGKRPMMGEIVSSCANYVIITNEDPYHEDPMQIINEVAAGVPLCHSEPRSSGEKNPEIIYNNRNNTGSFTNVQDDIFRFTENVNFWKILDRRAAIKKALQIAKHGDFVIVTGKGAEEIMAVGKERIPWNDRKVIEEELKKIVL